MQKWVTSIYFIEGMKKSLRGFSAPAFYKKKPAPNEGGFDFVMRFR